MRRADLAAVVVLAVAVAAFAPVLGAGLNYDEAVYLASADALRHGQALGGDVYASQPPGWFAFLEGVLAVVGRSVDGARLVMVTLAAVGCAAAYAIARAYGGAVAGVAAGAALALAPPWPEFAGRVEADPASVALALCSLACALWSARAAGRRGDALAVVAGALFALALSVKLLVVPFVVPLVAVAVADRARVRRLVGAAAGFAVAAALVLLPHVRTLGEIADGALGFHAEARDVGDRGPSNLERVLEFPHPRTPFAWLCLAGLVVAVVGLARSRRLEAWPLWTLALASTLFVLWIEPLHDHHLVLLAASWILPAATTLGVAAERLPPRPRAVAAGALALLLAAALVQEHRRVSRLEAERDDVEAAARALRSATGGEQLVATDLPQVAFLADRRVPGDLVDASAVRFLAASLTPEDVVAEIGRPDVGAVAIGREFREHPEIAAAARERFPRRTALGEIELYAR